MKAANEMVPDRIPPHKRLGQGRGRRSFDGITLDVSMSAEFLGWTEKTVRARVARRQVPFRKFGGRIIFLREELEKFMQVLPGCGVEEALINGGQRE